MNMNRWVDVQRRLRLLWGFVLLPAFLVTHQSQDGAGAHAYIDNSATPPPGEAVRTLRMLTVGLRETQPVKTVRVPPEAGSGQKSGKTMRLRSPECRNGVTTARPWRDFEAGRAEPAADLSAERKSRLRPGNIPVAGEAETNS